MIKIRVQTDPIADIKREVTSVANALGEKTNRMEFEALQRSLLNDYATIRSLTQLQ